MSKIFNSKVNRQINQFKKSLLHLKSFPISDLFCHQTVMDIVENTPQKHVSVFPPLITLKAFIVQVLSDDSSCKQAVASILVDRLYKGQPANAIHTGGYCKARMRLPLKYMVNAVKRIGLRLHLRSRESWKWKGFNVVILDGTTALGNMGVGPM